MRKRVRIAHLSGPTATIQNTPPLVTSNKSREKRGLPLRLNADGSAMRFDALRAQRLAMPAKIYVEQFSAHPLEADAAELYGPPDGFIGSDGQFRNDRQHPDDKPVYEVELLPEDGLYPLPYMAVQASGAAWEEECAEPGAPAARSRQGFFPDGHRSFEEIDRLSIGQDGTSGLLSALADIDFYRGAPPGGFTKGLPEHLRTDVGEGDIAPETRGAQFFAYKPYHMPSQPVRPVLAKMANDMQALASSGDYDGMIWTQGSPQIEETAYWYNLLIDTTLPICGNAAQRPQGQISNDGTGDAIEKSEVAVKDAQGRLLGDAIPVVSIIKDGSYSTLDFGDDPSAEHDLIASIEHKLSLGKLAGLVCEGLVPYGITPSTTRHRLLLRASYCGLPVVNVGRGASEGFADPQKYHIAGSNLTATKARLLLMACLLKFGSLPPAANPDAPTIEELAAIRERVAAYQSIFDTH